MILISRTDQVFSSVNIHFFFNLLIENKSNFCVFFTVRNLHPNVLTSAEYTKILYVKFNFVPSRLTWKPLKSYSKTNMKSNGEKASLF